MPAWLLMIVVATGNDALRVLPAETEAGPTKQAYQRYVQAEAAAALARRTEQYEALKTPEDVAVRKAVKRELFIKQLGGFPERTPLNPQVVGRGSYDGYRLEKVIFKSRPRHYVTGVMYLPTSPPPYPGVLVPCGHSANGKAYASYQAMCALLARNGMAAFCYDPIGQGERNQVLDESGVSRLKGTGEHTALGIGAILVGSNAAAYFIWDGLRALDYLCGREDVDATKIGCTGNSGGGLMTEYLMGLDDRIVCAAPGCSNNSFARRMQNVHLGDAEQNVFGQISLGIEHADFIHMRAPRPTLLLCATRDFVDIRGGWEMLREAKRIYTRFGYPERVDLVEADEKHGFTQPLRTASVRWMRRWLMGKDDAVDEPPFEPLPDDALRCTPDGQVQRLADARSVVDLNLAAAAAAAEHRRELWKPENREAALPAVRRRIGIEADPPAYRIASPGGEKPHDNSLGFITITPENGTDLPGLLFTGPDGTGKRCVIYVNGMGKHVDAGPNGPIERLIDAGATVLALDLRASGEVGSGGPGGTSYFDAVGTYLLGRSLVGGRVDDLRAAADFLRKRFPTCEQVELVAVGAATVPALHAAALEPKLFQHVTLRGGLRSWLDVVRDPTIATPHLADVVHGALLDYDLPDLVNSLQPGVVTIEDEPPR